MDFDSALFALLRKKLAEWLGWERRKRRESTIAAIVCYALLLSVATQPLSAWFSLASLRWFVPAIFAAGLAPLLFMRYRWRSMDSVRALARLDKALGLEERALTSWEVLQRRDRAQTALLVLKQAQEKIAPCDAKALSRRSWTWHAYAAAPLFCLWFAIVWFDVDWHFQRSLPSTTTIAYELRQFSRQLQEKARAEGLKESLKWGRELETFAQKNIDAGTDGGRLKRELAGIAKKIEMAGSAAADGEQSFATVQNEQDLKDLRAEVDTLRDFFNAQQAKGTGDSAQDWLDRFAGMPQLKRQLDTEGERRAPGQTMDRSELQAYIDQLENQVARELDRRSLLDAQRFLDQLVRKPEENKTDSAMQFAGRGEQQMGDESDKTTAQSSLPGDEPGGSPHVFDGPRQLDHGPETQLKGLPSVGAHSSLIFKGKPVSGKSEVSQDELVASYQRQAEADLNREQVPDGLRELIKNYFLSLGTGEGQP